MILSTLGWVVYGIYYGGDGGDLELLENFGLEVEPRICIERSRLIELQQGIGQFLQATESSSGEPLEGYCQLSGKPGIEVKIICLS